MAGNPKEFQSAFETYKVIRVHDEGGSGRIFIVKDSENDTIALKCLLPERVTADRSKRFKNEIEFCRKQNHVNIVKILDEGFALIDNVKCPFYVMPLYPKNLRSLIASGISHDKILTLYSQLLDGVEAAHKKGVWHRDLKPENILYDPSDDRTVVADFGIAHFEEDIIATPVKTRPNSKMANLGYSAPEQRKRGASIDEKVDIYALGLILNEMFTRDVPQGTGYKTISSVSIHFAYLDGLVEQMLQQTPSARPSSIDEIKKILIARRNDFIARQELDKKRDEVVPVTEIADFDPIKIIDTDYQDGHLVFKLSRIPDGNWIKNFHQPKAEYHFTANYEPVSFNFIKNIARVPMQNENVAQRLANYFEQYVQVANNGYATELRSQAAQKEKELRDQLVREVEEAERRARILKSIK